MTRRGLRATAGATLTGALLLGAGSLAAQAHPTRTVASVAGVWEITLTNGEPSFDWNVTFEQDGSTLSGFAEMQGRIFFL